VRYLALVLLLLTACFGKSAALEAGGGDDKQNGAAFCGSDMDCVAVAPTCCECPTYATSVDDPVFLACSTVDCPPPPTDSACPLASAVCSAEGICELRTCLPIQCPSDCPAGYATDANGCLTCQCAGAPANGCMVDGDCVETRADCCGCALGGTDTAVLERDQAAFDAALNCPAAPTCPGVNVCDPNLAPRCVSGGCVLTNNAPLPANACGRPDLPPCPEGTHCTVNASDPANMQGVGTCEP
jgi:hypothetical protein